MYIFIRYVCINIGAEVMYKYEYKCVHIKAEHHAFITLKNDNRHPTSDIDGGCMFGVWLIIKPIIIKSTYFKSFPQTIMPKLYMHR